jgi:single-strand DNA-binding protein
VINQVLIDGRLTRDPELSYVGTGTALLKLGIAHNEYRKDESKPNGWDQTVSFFEVTAWGKLAENMKGMLAKGSPVVISGKLNQDRWKDKNDGSNRQSVKIVAMKILLLHAKTAEGQREEAASAISDGPHVEESQLPAADGFTDDIPF